MEKDSNLADIERKLREFEEMARQIADISDREKELKRESDAIKN